MLIFNNYSNIDCDDGNPATNDYCDNSAGCVHEVYSYQGDDDDSSY